MINCTGPTSHISTSPVVLESQKYGVYRAPSPTYPPPSTGPPINAYKLTSPPAAQHKPEAANVDRVSSAEPAIEPAPKPAEKSLSPADAPAQAMTKTEKATISVSPTRLNAETISNNALLAAKANIPQITHQAAILDMHPPVSPIKRIENNTSATHNEVAKKVKANEALATTIPAKRPIEMQNTAPSPPANQFTDNANVKSVPAEKQSSEYKSIISSTQAKQPSDSAQSRTTPWSRITEPIKPNFPIIIDRPASLSAGQEKAELQSYPRPTSPVKQYDDSNLLKQIERLKEHMTEISRTNQTAATTESAKIVAEIQKSASGLSVLESKIVNSTKPQFQSLETQIRAMSKQSELNLQHFDAAIKEISPQAMFTELQQSILQIHTLMQQIQKDLINQAPPMSEENTLHRSPQDNMDVTVDMGDIESIESENEIHLDPPQITMLQDQLNLATQGNLRLIGEVQSHKLEHDRMEQEMNTYKMTIQSLNAEKQQLSQQIKILQEQTAQQITDFAARNKRVKDLKKQNTTMAQMLMSIAK